MSTRRTSQRIGFVVLLVAIVALGAGLRAAWQAQIAPRGIGGDGLHYWHMAAHLQREHSITIDGKKPNWTRLPGYPAWLALTTNPAVSDVGAMDAESIRVRVQAWMRRQMAVDLATDLACAIAAVLLGLGLGLGLGARKLALVGAFLWAVQPWSTVISIHPLSDGLSTLLTTLALAALVRAVASARALHFAFAGVLVGLGQWVRADAILLVPPLLLGGVLAVRGGPWLLGSVLHVFRARLRLVAVAVLAAALVFSPWPLRNLVRFGEAHPFGGSVGIDNAGEPVDRSAVFEWMRTFSVGSEADLLNVTWRFPGTHYTVNDVPQGAIDSPAERAALAAILDEYNRKGARLDGALEDRLRVLARAHRDRHPIDFFVWKPLLRIGSRLFAPRDGYGLGTLPTIASFRTAWQIADGAVIVLGLLGLVGLVVVRKTRPAGLVVGSWFGLRLLMLATLPASEPRYFLEAMPLLYAACASLPGSLGALRHRANAGATDGEGGGEKAFDRA